MSILFITHDLGPVSGFADQGAGNVQREIVEEGTVSDIFNNPLIRIRKDYLHAGRRWIQG